MTQDEIIEHLGLERAQYKFPHTDSPVDCYRLPKAGKYVLFGDQNIYLFTNQKDIEFLPLDRINELKV